MEKGTCTDLTIKDSIFILKWIYDFVKIVDVWQLSFSKFSKWFSEITMLRVVISRHSKKFYEIHEPCKMLKFREGWWFCNAAFIFAKKVGI